MKSYNLINMFIGFHSARGTSFTQLFTELITQLLLRPLPDGGMVS